MELIGLIILAPLIVVALFTNSASVCLVMNGLCLLYCGIGIWKSLQKKRWKMILLWALAVAVNCVSAAVNLGCL